jgi:hypothetical protein
MINVENLRVITQKAYECKFSSDFDLLLQRIEIGTIEAAKLAKGHLSLVIDVSTEELLRRVFNDNICSTLWVNGNLDASKANQLMESFKDGLIKIYGFGEVSMKPANGFSQFTFTLFW